MPSPEMLNVATQFADILTALALIVAGIWGVRNYRRVKRIDAAKWLHELGREFQTSPDMERGKILLDYQYRDRVEPLLSRLVIHWNEGLSEEDLSDILAIDKVLNEFEHLLYLEQYGHITRADRQTYFGSWFALFRQPHRGVLRRYCTNYGYTQLADQCLPEHHQTQADEYILVYGTLCKGQDMHKKLRMHELCEFVDEVRVSGCLYDLGEYPGLVLYDDLDDEDKATSSTVAVQLFRVTEPDRPSKPKEVLTNIDKYERCFPPPVGVSEYRRTTLSVHVEKISRNVDAWLYVYQKDTTGRPHVVDLNWSDYLAQRSGPS
ncbi:MAG: gamma-glutamylcyclotransferase family protein [Pseudomonadota bacterium]